MNIENIHNGEFITILDVREQYDNSYLHQLIGEPLRIVYIQPPFLVVDACSQPSSPRFIVDTRLYKIIKVDKEYADALSGRIGPPQQKNSKGSNFVFTT